MNGPDFATIEDAYAWMKSCVDDPCVDNHRFAFKDDDNAVGEYTRQQDEGCCGFFDADITVAGRPAMIGCNYGH